MGASLDEPGHYTRLRRSLSDFASPNRCPKTSLRVVLKETVRRNRVRDGIVYLQISRGAAPRDHPFPPPSTLPSVVVVAKSVSRKMLEARAAKGVGVVTLPDNRWGRCDLKTVGLLPNVLAKQAAREAGAFEAWFVDEDGLVTEGTASNAWIVDAQGASQERAISPTASFTASRAPA
ncbi:MAG: aminotransferase class IV [Terricaulis sp.]